MRETVGEAYVRILADGDGLDRSIRDELDDVDFDKNGRRNSAEWLEGWKKEMDKAPNQTKLRDAISGPLTRGDWLNNTFFRSSNWNNFRSGLEKEYGDAGKRAGEAFERDLLNGMDFDTLNRRLGNLTPELVKMRKSIQRELEASEKEARDFERDWRKSFDSINDQTERINKNFSRDMGSIAKTLEGTRTSIRNSGFAFAKEQGIIFETKPHEKFRRSLVTVDRDLDLFSHRTATLFGKGSRNNFLNFFGGLIGGVLSLTRIVPKGLQLLGKLKNAGAELGETYTLAGGGIKGMSAVANGMFSTIASGLPGLIAMGAVLLVLSTTVGVVVSLISGLTAAVTAMAGSVSFAVVGALAPLLGTVLPLAAGIGVLVGAIIALDDKTKKALSTAIKPMTSEFKALGKIAAGEVFRDAALQAQRLGPILSGLRPLVRGVGAAVRDVGYYWIDALDSPAFRAFKRDLTAFLPNAVRLLGQSVVNFGAGMGGIFRGLIPITDRFLRWLSKITTEFANWSNSARGQREIKAFLRDAADSAKSVGRFLGTAGKALGRLLDAGRGSGDTIFDKMSRGIQKFVGYLDANPGAVDRWFKSGEKIAEDLGDIIHSIAGAVRALDTDANRALASGSLKGLSALLTTMAGGAILAADAIRESVHAFGGFTTATGKALQLLGKLPGNKWMKGIGNSLVDAGGKMLKFGSHVDEATGKTKKLGAQRPNVKTKLTDGITRPRNLIDSRLRSMMGIRTPANAKVKLDPGAALTAAGRISLKLAGLNRTTANPRVRLDVAGANASLNGFKRNLSLLHDETVNVTTFYHVKGNPRGRQVTARGGMFNFAQERLIAEAGREAVVPLDRPLGQIDPAVRWLAAIAQGKAMPMASGGVVGGGRTIQVAEGAIQIFNPNPKAAGVEVLNRITANAY